ncbi:MAG: zinc metallopeptidase [Dehalococcoidia bacterium]|nr:MAG: zinc metallopeptidase [Dehalococcoidia bacterium]
MPTLLLYFVLAAPAIFVMLYAQRKMRSAYSKYSKVANRRGITGLEAAQMLLRANGLVHVRLEGTRGNLTDHYDPRRRVLRLSRGVSATPSVAALGIVAHEVGHAVQHSLGYAPMRVRSALVPVANLGSRLGFIFFFLGIIIYSANLVWIGVGLFGAAVAFSLVTLPVEYDASNRARRMLQGAGLVSEAELEGVSSVLSAAALTYVAALLQAVANLLFFVLIALGMRR